MLETDFSFDAYEGGPNSPLKNFSWGELRARLDAAQQLRGVLAAQASKAVIEAAGRFEVTAAKQALRSAKPNQMGQPAETGEQRKLTVNPDPSINSKDECVIAEGEAAERVHPARGQE